MECVGLPCGWSSRSRTYQRWGKRVLTNLAPHRLVEKFNKRCGTLTSQHCIIVSLAKLTNSWRFSEFCCRIFHCVKENLCWTLAIECHAIRLQDYHDKFLITRSLLVQSEDSEEEELKVTGVGLENSHCCRTVQTDTLNFREVNLHRDLGIFTVRKTF